MKLILASQGFLTPEIVEATAGLVGKPKTEINVAIINAAYPATEPGHDLRWIFDELNHIPKQFGGVISFVDLRAASDMTEVRQRLEFADIIYIVGGKQLILPKLFREIGFDSLLRELAETRVVFGTSAGANVLGRQIKNPAYWQARYGASEEYLANPQLGLVDFNILPHLGRADHANLTVGYLTPLLENETFPIYAINDQQAVVYDNGQVSFVGGEPIKFGNRN
jgi:dipeptidase E